MSIEWGAWIGRSMSFEIESLDRFYAVLRERYANLSNLGQEAQQLVDRLNEYAVEGARELYEVIV
jgi:hypothetical protein